MGRVSRCSGWWPFVSCVVTLAIFFAGAARSYFGRYHLPVKCELALYLCLMLLVVLSVIPAFSASRMLLQRWRHRHGFAAIIVGCWLTPYVVYAVGCNDFRWPALGSLLALSGVPIVVYVAVPVRNLSVLSWQDAVVWGWLVLAMILRRWGGIWNVPTNLDFMARLFVIAVASWCWVFVRPVPGFGYGFSSAARTLRAVTLNFACFAAVAIPLSLATNFANWAPRWRGVQTFGIALVEIFIFIAWLEELLFRGFLQTLLSTSLKSALLGQLVASIVFGFSHILLAPAPNWRYVALASIAGWFYGTAFRQSGNLVGPAITHALVDAAWRTWFGGRG